MTLPETMPVLFATRSLLFPGGLLPFRPCTRSQLYAIAAATSDELDTRTAVLVATPEPGTSWWHSVGTAVRIVGAARTSCCDRWIAELYGIERVRVIAPCQLRPFVTARCVLLDDPVEDPLHLQALARAIAELAARIARRFPHGFHVARARERLSAVEAPRELCGAVASLLFHVSLADQLRILEAEPLSARLESVVAHLHEFIARDLGSPATIN